MVGTRQIECNACREIVPVPADQVGPEPFICWKCARKAQALRSGKEEGTAAARKLIESLKARRQLRAVGSVLSGILACLVFAVLAAIGVGFVVFIVGLARKLIIWAWT